MTGYLQFKIRPFHLQRNSVNYSVNAFGITVFYAHVNRNLLIKVIQLPN